MKISKLDRKNNRLRGFIKPGTEDLGQQLDILNTIEVTGDIIKYKLENTNEDYTAIEFELDINVIRENLLFADQTMWAVQDEYLKNNIGSVLNITSENIDNIFQMTLPKRDPLFKEGNGYHFCPLKLFFPTKNSTIDEVVLFLEISNSDTTTTTVVAEGATITEIESYKELLEPIVVTSSTQSTSAGETLELSITCDDVTEVFVEPICGIVNKTRVPIINGVGTLFVSSEGLVAGDEIKIKFNHKYYSRLAMFTRTID